MRAAVSIARRLQDPLGELVKLDPKTLGAGQHHHDVPHALVHRAIDAAIEDAVASVGVDLNTASRALLARVPGLSPALAAAIVEHRSAHGPFATRRGRTRACPGSPRACSLRPPGFLRVRGGEHPLDATAVHPERYAALEALAARHGRAVGELARRGRRAACARHRSSTRSSGRSTRADVATALEQAGRDPRPPFVAFAFRDDVRAIEDLKPGMVCPGLVTNVTSFGVFVDVGARQDGLVHVSQLEPAKASASKPPLQPGDRVEVRVLKVDLEKKQVSLSMKPRPERRPAARPQAGAGAARDPSRGPRPIGPRPAAGKRPDPRRSAPDTAAARQDRAAGRSPAVRRADGRPTAPPAARKPEPRRPAFNNPFAVLAGLKKNDKG